MGASSGMSSLCAALAEEAQAAQREAARLRAELALARSAALADDAETTTSGARMLVARLDGADNKSLQVVDVITSAAVRLLFQRCWVYV